MDATHASRGNPTAPLLRAVILEDDPKDLELMVHRLEDGGYRVQFEVADSPQSFQECLGKNACDVVLADFNLGGWTAIDALEILKQSGEDTPLIVVTGCLGDEAAAECITRGAVDYILKDRLARLPAAVREALRRKWAENASKESEERYRSLVMSIPDVVWTFDSTGHVTFISPNVQTLSGYSAEEAYRSAPSFFSEAVHPDDLRRVQKAFEAASGKPFELEFRLKCKDGRWIWVRNRVIGGHEKDGVRFWHGLLSDVTERKQLEQQLIMSQKIEAVGRLAGGIAHDFNNLLTMINGYSQLLLERLEPDAPFTPFVQEIKDAGDRAASLTRQLLAFSRRQIMTFEVLDLNSVVSGLEKMLKRLIGEDILLRTVLDPALGHIKADPGQIEQIVMNLAVNARDAMPLGGELTLETANVQLDEAFVRTHMGATAGPSVMLALSDTGAGMTAETKARIFEPFFTTKEPGKGTGLGLATVYGIVKQMEGSIWVSSELGLGAVFKIYFPRVDEVPAAETKVAAQFNPVSRSEIVLLVEDEVGVRGFVCSALESSGYKVLVAKDAEDAISICEKHEGPIHLLLTDVVMPRMSGPMVAERVRSLRPGIKVLYTSGHTDHPVLRREVLGAHLDFLAKPFSPDALLKKIREVLTKPATSPD
jgi:hypothetical protein